MGEDKVRRGRRYMQNRFFAKKEGGRRSWRDTSFQNSAFIQHTCRIGYNSKHAVFGNKKWAKGRGGRAGAM